jgi:RES domain-containing protein
MDANGSLRDRQPHQSLHGSVMNLCSEEKHYLLLAPSVLAPNENNCLINPAHGDYKRIA